MSSALDSFLWISDPLSDLLPSTVSLLVFRVPNCYLFPQHPFVTQLLTRNLIIELLDVANNPELHSSHSHTMDDTELEVSHDCKQSTSGLAVTCCDCFDDHCVGVLMGRRLATQLQIRFSQLGNTCLQRGHYLKNNVRTLALSRRCSVSKLGQSIDSLCSYWSPVACPVASLGHNQGGVLNEAANSLSMSSCWGRYIPGGGGWLGETGLYLQLVLSPR